MLRESAFRDDVSNKTISDDLFNAAKYLPDAFVDLLIADPPYNMTKTFGSSKFKKSTLDEYREYTELWLDAIQHTLKKPPLFMYAVIGTAVWS